MDSKNDLWTRRSNPSRLSLSTNDRDGKNDASTRTFTSKRFGGETSSHGGRSNPFNTMSPLTTSSTASPTTKSSASFGLGSGAFASFGSANKTPKTPGSAFDFGKASSAATIPPPPADKREKEREKPAARSAIPSRTMGGSSATTHTDDDRSATDTEQNTSESNQATPSYPLKYSWTVWYRPPTSKNSDYEKSIRPMCRMSTAIEFWKVYSHLIHPSALPTVSDYHFFKEGIRPVWEDDENKKGGKWIMRLKKGVADRYWEDLLLALIGDQFAEAGEEVCGAVVSVRSGEDVFSIWTKNDGGRNVKIRETIKRVLSLPTDTVIQWKSHDDSISHRTAIDQARQEKTTHHATDKRRGTLSGENNPASKDK